MNPLFILLGAAAVSKLGGGYPKEINNLKDQIPKDERDAFLKQYKSLSSQAKNDFKTALKNADMNTASQIIGQDLTKYNVAAARQATQAAGANAAGQLEQQTQYQEGSDFIARIEKILAVPTSIDPALVAEAAKKYEAAVPTGSNINIAEKTRKLLELQG